ncbi:hypothetical protein EV359DRAFT_66613 [Lentinula novae-zelandiae]|nr:hypothetical protein EV359DRAFT_66613 [Lentinula novae-zelandiae]
MQAIGKAKKSEICQEFVAVETYTQKLLHNVTVLTKENQIMKEYLGNHRLYFDVCLHVLEENIDLRVKMAVAAEIDKLQKGEGAEPEDDDSDEDELEDDEVEKKKEVKREGLTSHAASNSNLIKVLIALRQRKIFLGHQFPMVTNYPQRPGAMAKVQSGTLPLVYKLHNAKWDDMLLKPMMDALKIYKASTASA